MHSTNTRPRTAFAAINLDFFTTLVSRPQHPQAQLKQLFRDIDVDKNGRLDLNELRAALCKLGLPSSEDYLREMMHQYDENQDGTVDWAEFQKYVGRREADIRAAFEKLDAHWEGRISAAALEEDLQHAGLPAGRDDAHKMIQLLDRNKDGVITYDEFRRFVCLLPAAQVVNHNTLFCWVDSADYMDGVECRLCMIPPKHPMQRLLAGGLAGAISRTLVAPLERLRTIRMTGRGSESLSQSVEAMWKDGGLRGLFKGNAATILKVFPQSAIQFATYDCVKDAFMAIFHHKPGSELRQAEKMLAGCVAGASSTVFTYPLETIRTRMSMAGGGGLLTSMALIRQHQGLGGFYQGFTPALINDIISNGLGFWSYELGQTLYRRCHNGKSPSPQERGLIGACTAVVVMSVTMPFEVIMRRLQVQGSPGHPVLYHGLRHAIVKMARDEGPGAFFRGSLSSYLKVAPSIGATYFLYALIVQLWGIRGLRRYPHDDRQQQGSRQAAKAANGSRDCAKEMAKVAPHV
ncbi:hypothetical protein WJX72_009417 [[Myrmecia] bisecta]|uniref:EF-hand domain-containing protein n=1 Tax=[Myrmecia] bisecta TaxID=41462 RepID=A0AAW1PT14_9CHLO